MFMTSLLGFVLKWESSRHKSKIDSTAWLRFLDDCLKMNRTELLFGIKTYIVKHLEIVSAQFQSDFSDTRLDVSWY